MNFDAAERAYERMMEAEYEQSYRDDRDECGDCETQRNAAGCCSCECDCGRQERHCVCDAMQSARQDR